VNDEVSMLKGGAQANPTKIWSNMKQLLWECTVDRRGNVNFTDSYTPVQKCKFYVPLSGTPIQNKPGDMWAYLHLFAPRKFPKLSRFEDEYAYGWRAGQKKLRPQDVERIINVMDGQVIRRSKDDELDLPAKMYNPIEVPMTEKQRELYNQMKENFFIWVDNKKEEAIQANVVISWIIRLWQIALFPGMMKMFDSEMKEVPVECQESGILDRAMEIIESTVNADEKLVVWSSWFNGPLFELQKRCDMAGIKAALYTGEQNTYQRNLAVESFISDDDNSVQVMLINRAAGGMGLDGLQRSSTCIQLDLWWNYAANEQAIDRQHRIGQDEHLMIHQLQAEDSVYAFVKAKADSKQEMAESIMESRELRKGEDWITYLEGMI
jgi:SNF2 family DNA or RNA helicase